MNKRCLIFGLLQAALMVLIGCQTTEFADGYQAGDITRFTGRQVLELEAARHDYCTQAADSAIRQAALDFIRMKAPEIPENGICAELSEPLTRQYHLTVTEHEPDR